VQLSSGFYRNLSGIVYDLDCWISSLSPDGTRLFALLPKVEHDEVEEDEDIPQTLLEWRFK
jgi:hypothetical protein